LNGLCRGLINDDVGDWGVDENEPDNRPLFRSCIELVGLGDIGSSFLFIERRTTGEGDTGTSILQLTSSNL
jgi:hypothetical protein